MGRFKKNNPGCNCCGTPPARQVLIWDAAGDVNADYGGQLGVCKAIWEANGHTVHKSADYSGTLADYDLIAWTMAEADPSWWGQITGATWSGRLFLTAEHSGFSDTIAYVNGISGVTGISVTAETPFTGGAILNTKTHPLTAGQADLRMADCSILSGGTDLADFITGGGNTDVPWLQENTVGNISFVVSADSSFVADHLPGAAAYNAQFVLNLVEVDV